MMGLMKPELKVDGPGFIKTATANDLSKYERETAEYNEQANSNDIVVDNLAGHVRKLWVTAYQAKQEIDNRLLDCLRQRNGEYSPEKLAMIKEQGGSEVFMMLTNIKCRAAESWINDIVFQPGENCWDISPTPMPDLPPNIAQRIEARVNQEAAIAIQFAAANGMPPITPDEIEAKVSRIKEQILEEVQKEAQRRAGAMKTKIEDQLVDAEWEEAMREFIKDVTTYPAAILRGPVYRTHKTLTWATKSGKWQPVVEKKIRLHFYRVSPFDFFPSPTSRNINDGYLFERHRMHRSDLAAMKDTPGVKNEALAAAILQYGSGGLRHWIHNDDARSRLEGRPNENIANIESTIDVLEFSGKVSGRMLLDYGMTDAEIPDETEEYECNLWLLGTYVIKCVLNPNPIGRRDYHTACFDRVAGSIWGKALPEIMRDAQDVCNACARSLINNMAMASGPMAEIYTDRLPAGEDVEDMRPWRIYQTKNDPNGTNNPAVRFFQPSINAEPLLRVYEHFSKLADDHTGIPAYSYGDSNASGAGRTASGLSMLMSAASRGIKMVIKNIDKPISDSIELVYVQNMLFEDDDSIKGDLQVVARGSTSLIAKEQKQVRLNEMLTATNNPVDMGIIGQDGRAVLLREAMKALDIVVDEVVPDDDEMRKRMQIALQQQLSIEGLPPQGGGAPQELDPAGNPVAGQDHATF